MDSLDREKQQGGDLVALNTIESTDGSYQNGSSVLLVTPPACANETNIVAPQDADESAEPPESASVPIVEAVTTRLQQHIQRLWVTADSSFGGNQGEIDGQNDDNDNTDNVDSTMLRELTERPISIVPSKNKPVVGGFDVCKEYGYKYEYTPDHHEDAQQDEDGEDEGVNNALGGGDSSLNSHQQHIAKSIPNLPNIYLLGKIYHPIHDYDTRRDDESSLFWFTYRCDFPEIRPYRITTDAGWGCMLRSAQMLLAHTFRLHYKSRQWKPSSSITRRRQDTFLRSILSWFADFPSKTDYPYSLHNMVAAGLTKYETLPGEWYGPGTASYVLRDLVALHEKQGQPSMIRVHVASEATVYCDSVHKLMTQESKMRALQRSKEKSEDGRNDDTPAEEPVTLTHPLDPAMNTPPEMNESEFVKTLEWDTGLLLLIPLRLGLNNFNGDYAPIITFSFSLPQSVGILGGRPRGARWFYGAYADGSKMIGLDPHTIQNAPSRRRQSQKCTNGTSGEATFQVELSEEYLRSVHTTFQEAVPISRTDPSISLGFYCRSKKDFEDLERSFETFRKQQGAKCPDLFTFADKAPDYSLSTAMNDMLLDGEEDGELGPAQVDPVDESSDEDDYVML